MLDRIDQIVGCIVGGAIGDAAGGPYEGQSPPFEAERLELGAISDDTQLTLATCEAIVQCKGRICPGIVAQRFIACKVAHLKFDALLLDAISAGGDTDTIASMVGHITGAYLGFSALPAPLVDQLAGHDLILSTARLFAECT